MSREVGGNDPIILQALRGNRPARTPVWFMRQAGRYLPEYREVRAKHSMLDVIRTPDLAAQVTLQPIERFGMDAAIIFADILNPLIGMGINLDFLEGEGPRIFNPVRTQRDAEALVVPAPEGNVGYTLEAIRICCKKLGGTPLIGFAGAPFTLSAYLIEGSSSDHLTQLKRFMREESVGWKVLQEKLEALVAQYLIAQVAAGAQAVQIFDSWVGTLSPYEFCTHVRPGLERIVRSVRAATTVPIVYFSTSSVGLYPSLAELDVDCIGVDWRVTMQDASKVLGAAKVLQGNLDPTLLFASASVLQPEVERVLRDGSALKAHIFNLGHGILPQTTPERVAQVISWVREFSPDR